MRQPLYLQLTDKWQVLQYWVSVMPRLTRCALAVLIRLLDHQNPKTGRCDPSTQTLQDRTGFCERSVRDAVTELEERGAIVITRKTLRSRNQVTLRNVEELKQNETARINRNRKSRGHPRSANPAVDCRSSLHSTAPEKEKKKKKEKGRKADSSHQSVKENKNAINHKSDDDSLEQQGTEHREQFERSVVKVIEKKGYSYTDLLHVDSNLFEDIYRSYSSGEITFSMALTTIISECKIAKCSE